MTEVLALVCELPDIQLVEAGASRIEIAPKYRKLLEEGWSLRSERDEEYMTTTYFLVSPTNQREETKMTDYPAWICSHCGDKHGRRPCGVATWHFDTCGVCGKQGVMVTEPRDFGHLKDTWKTGKQPDINTCPTCKGPADNGFDRCLPPNPYQCTKCEENNHE